MQSSIDLLHANMARIRVPDSGSRVHKQECCISFETARSTGGLFIDMNLFVAFGEEYVEWNYQKTGNPVYLNIKQKRKTEPENRPMKKPTLLAIGVNGGFDDRRSEYEEDLSILIMPHHVSLPLPCSDLPEKVRLSIDAILTAESAEKKEQVSSWMADRKRISEYALNLKQVDNGIIVPPSGWKCAECDKTDNLWLNLSDGMILCGRRNWDGSGGNNHAIEHYTATNYPLAVKLGTITSELEGADVFSYSEDESVVDPLLAQHLAFFGIDFSSLLKTEMTTAERELDQNLNFDWNRIQESGHEIEPLFGPGYTGLINLGNSCYLASVMQVIFSTSSFRSRYYENLSLQEAFRIAPLDPAVDLSTQLAKLGHGLLSGRYSKSEEIAGGISPLMFKVAIACNHPEFSSARQQDALEFFLHLLDQVEHAHDGHSECDPAKSFKFVVEERLSCPSGKLAYNRRTDYILSLNIPLHAATNKDELEAVKMLKKTRQMGKEEIMRPRVPLDACLQCFSAPEEVHDFYSTALSSKTTAIKITRLATFPPYLVLHMRRFVMEAGWVPRKLDVYLEVPDIIDISYLRSKGVQPGEELLPGEVDAPEVKDVLMADNDIVAQLASMGFSHLHCQKAAINTSNAGVEVAMNWLLLHLDDPDINDPLADVKEDADVDEENVNILLSFGFSEAISKRALRSSGGNVERAADWILSNPNVAHAANPVTSFTNKTSSVNPGLSDGEGRYKLMGMVSHIGTSTHCGHYVAHVYKDGQWVIFNDSKVGVSKDPPKEMGYLYFFERLVSSQSTYAR